MDGAFPRQGGHSLVPLTRSGPSELWPLHRDRRSKTPMVPAQSERLCHAPAARRRRSARARNTWQACGRWLPATERFELSARRSGHARSRPENARRRRG
ncbi:hypothetical protein MRX96_001015 [Rhipicephalus microplus]